MFRFDLNRAPENWKEKKTYPIEWREDESGGLMVNGKQQTKNGKRKEKIIITAKQSQRRV